MNLTTRCDLHLHSAASLTTGQWFSQYFQAPESYADPIRQYELCKARGMTLVTLTDHDSIEGGLQLIGRPDFFLSVSYTHLRAHETDSYLVCRLLLEKKNP